MFGFRQHLWWICYLIAIFELPVAADLSIRRSRLNLSPQGFEFFPADEHALLLLGTVATSPLACAQKCHEMTLCRTFNFDLQSSRCRLYEGDATTTGSIIISSSPRAMYGSRRLDVDDFADFGHPCSACVDSQSLRCVNGTCGCQVHSYFDGSVCRSEKLRGATCSSDNECRRDLNLTCMWNAICGFDNGTLTSSTSTATMTSLSYNATCPNRTWISSSNRQAQWLFDENYLDATNNYNATPTTAMSFTSAGYVRSAVQFAVNATPMLIVEPISLSSTSFTIDAWLYPTGFWNFNHHSLFGLCPMLASYQCLHLTFRRNTPNYYLHLGFYLSDCQGVTSIAANQWIHVAFVVDVASLQQRVYLNGVLENTCSISSGLNAPTANFTIGYIPSMDVAGGSTTYFQGYMDQATVSTRAKSSNEILELATLVAHFTFDCASLVADSGPNSLAATTQLTSPVSSGRFGQAIYFNGSSSSYFQASGFTALGTSNKPFSFSLWIRPAILQGILLHVSSQQTGHGWCVPLFTFAANGSLAAQVYYSGTVVPVVDPSRSVATLIWSHVVQTWSEANGLRLYVNDVLVASRLSSASSYSASGVVNYITVASALNQVPGCVAGVATGAAYKGDMDDFRVYSRELSASDVHALYAA